MALVSHAVCCALGWGVATAAAEPGASAVGEPPAEAVLAVLPFDPATPANTIVVDLAPKGNSRKLPFQLDTGATNSVVSPRLARSMGVKVSRVKTDPYRRRTVLGRDVHFYVDTRRSDTASSSGLEYGVLGGDFLARYVVELDFAQHRVRFFDPERYAVPDAVSDGREAVLPLALVSNRPGLTLSLDGRAVEVLVDTGAQFGLMLSGAIAERAGIAYTPLPGFTIQGFAGRVDGHVGDVARLEIGPFAFERVPAAVAPNGFSNLGFPGDSLIGYDLLAQFLVRIDYPRQRIWLRRNEAAAPLFDPRRTDAGPRGRRSSGGASKSS